MSQNLAERLKKLLVDKNINARKLAIKAKLGESFVYDILNGNSKSPTLKNITTIADILEVSIDELLYGDSKIKPSENSEMIALTPLIVKHDGVNNSVQPAGVDQQYFDRKWIKDNLSADVENIQLINIFNDSIEPILYAGDSILVDTSKRNITSGVFFAIYDGITIDIRKISFDNDSHDKIKITAENKKYPDIICSKEDVEIIGKVAWLSRVL